MREKITRPPESIDDLNYRDDMMQMIVDRWLVNGGMNQMKHVMREAFSEVLEEKLKPVHDSIHTLKIISYSTAAATLILIIYHAI